MMIRLKYTYYKKNEVMSVETKNLPYFVQEHTGTSSGKKCIYTRYIPIYTSTRTGIYRYGINKI